MDRPPAKGGQDQNEAKSVSIRRCGSIGRHLARRRFGVSSKAGSILKIYTVDRPASMSILEEATGWRPSFHQRQRATPKQDAPAGSPPGLFPPHL